MRLSAADLAEGGAEPARAAALLARVNECLAATAPEERWRRISQQVLCPADPFELHRFLYEKAHSGLDPYPPAWFPDEERLERANVTALQRELGLGSYAELHAWSARHREAFWEEMVRRLGIRLRRPFERIVNLSGGAEAPHWLVGARLNIAESCFQAQGDETAILFQQEGGSPERFSYAELEELSSRVAGGLGAMGFGPGDAVAIDMPMTAEAVAIYLGIVRLGGVVVAIADSFAAAEIAARLRLGRARAIFTQDFILRGGRELPLYKRVVEAQAPPAVVLPCQGEKVGVELRYMDLSWEHFLGAGQALAAVPCAPEQHTNILFSSGTTGDPKAIPWTQATPIKCAADGHLHQDIHPGDVVAWPTNLGWMMGPWLIYASLVNRATMALYYGAPTGRDFGQFVQQAGVNLLGVVPSLVRAWRASACMEGLDWSRVRTFSSTGECSNAQDMLYLMYLAGYKPVVEYCGGTELAGAYLCGTVVQPAAPAAFTTPALGMDFAILDEEGRDAENGEAFLIPPSIGMSTELLNRDHHEVYFAGAPMRQGVPLRRHGDQVERLAGGGYRVHGRVDDTMNLGGIKVSSAEIERVLNAVEGVGETAAIAVAPAGGGPSRLVVYAVLREEVPDLPEKMQQAIRHKLNPLFKIHEVVAIDALPRTASNKVMRRALRQGYAG
jgi:acetyl-CoA synthetase